MQVKKPALIKLENVSFRYQNEEVLDHISLEVEQGDFVGIIGPNGSGKTTLLRIILGRLAPQKGLVYLFGQSIPQFKNWPRIGYVPQKATFSDASFPVTVEELVMEGRIAQRGLIHFLTAEDNKAVRAALQAVDMAGVAKRLMRELSGGQQQRVFIARALASEPELLILDEPTVGVDIESQEEFYELLSKLRKTKGLTLVMVSHDVEVVVNEVNKLICINKQLVYHGSPQHFVSGDYFAKLYGKKRSLILHGH